MNNITCPSCHGNSVFKLHDGKYKCNYCQAEFSAGTPYKMPGTKTAGNLREPENLESPTASQVRRTKLLFIVIAIGIMAFIAGVAAFLFLAE